MEFEINMDDFKQIALPKLNENIKNIEKYFENMPISLNNLKSNLRKKLTLYLGALNKYGGTMLCVPTQDGFELFIDDGQFPTIKNIYINHELLHIGSNNVEDNKNYFGHNEDYLGIDEAVTELFAEEIEEVSQDNDETYLWFIVNVMRINGLIFGMTNLADQYLNATDSFEKKFNEITNNKFDEFAKKITDIYHLLRKKEYFSLTEAEKVLLNNEQNELLEFMRNLVEINVYNNSTLYSKIINSKCNSKFLSLLYETNINKNNSNKLK